MTEQASKYPPMFLTACTLFSIGVLALLGTLLFYRHPPYLKGFFLLSSSLMGFGAGEILNHPKEPVPRFSVDGDNTLPQFYRRRNTCGLGNLLIIVALLLFSGGISSLIYQ
jgi:hypothetical protein